MATLHTKTDAFANIVDVGGRKCATTQSTTARVQFRPAASASAFRSPLKAICRDGSRISDFSPRGIFRSGTNFKISAVIYFVIFVSFSAVTLAADEKTYIDSLVEMPSKCETCKYVVVELENRLRETGRTHDVLTTGSRTMLDDDSPKKRDAVKTKKYRYSELRFVETLEDLCERLLTYNLHKEHKDSRRFAKGRSQTMSTLHGLVEKGVKVELGIPYDLWDSPSVEVAQMKRECEMIVEDYEADLEQWYFYDDDDPRRAPLMKYLCEDRVLRHDDRRCLKETEEETSDRKKREGEIKKKGRNKKGDEL